MAVGTESWDPVAAIVVIYHTRIKFSGTNLQLDPYKSGLNKLREPGVYVGMSPSLRKWLNWGAEVFPGVNYTKVRTERVR